MCESVILPRGLLLNGSAVGNELWHVTASSDLNGTIWKAVPTPNSSRHRVFFSPVPARNNGDYLARRQVEAAFEVRRADAHSNLPSRSYALFASLTKTDAEAWMSKPERANCSPVRLELMDDARFAIANLIWFNYAVRVANGSVKKNTWHFQCSDIEGELGTAAARYWSGERAPFDNAHEKWEALVQGSVRIQRI